MKKRILIYSDCFTYSGSENVIANILRSDIINQDFELRFFYAYNDVYDKQVKQKISWAFEDGKVKPIRIFSEVNLKNKLQTLTKNTISYYLHYCLLFIFHCLRFLGIFSFLNFFVFDNLFRKHSPDILVINNGGYPGALSCRIAALVGKYTGIKKVIFIVNNMAFPAMNKLDSLLDKFVACSVDTFITASVAAKNELIKKRNFAPQKCINIPNTLNDEEKIFKTVKGTLRSEFNIDQDTLIIGSVGLLTKRKGYHILIDAINELQKKNDLKNILFFIFGEGEEKEKLERQIRTYNLESKVLLPGFRNNVIKYMADFDVFVLPSTNNEDFPYVILEAMALGKPIIGTDVAGIPEQVIDDVNGIIVKPNSTFDLSTKLAIMANASTKKRYLMGEESIKKYRNDFSYTFLIDGKYNNLLKRAV